MNSKQYTLCERLRSQIVSSTRTGYHFSALRKQYEKISVTCLLLLNPYARTRNYSRLYMHMHWQSSCLQTCIYYSGSASTWKRVSGTTLFAFCIFDDAFFCRRFPNAQTRWALKLGCVGVYAPYRSHRCAQPANCQRLNIDDMQVARSALTQLAARLPSSEECNLFVSSTTFCQS